MATLSLYDEKENFFSTWQYDTFASASASEFYRDLFPVGTFEKRLGKLDDYPKTNLGNGFIVYTTPSERKRTRMVFDDHKEILELLDNPCAFMSPIAYFGRNRTAKNARFLYALTFDLDDVGEAELKRLFGFWVYQKRVPCPTYVVNSGGGVHLYYFLKKPLNMTPANQKSIKKIKYAMTGRIWNGDTSRIEKPQYQGLNQGFRLVGGLTKNGERVTAWRTGERIDVAEFIRFIPEDVQVQFKIFSSKISLAEAKEKYPDWYHERIELGREKKSWNCKRALYDWWKRQVEKIEFHHRYFFIMSLTIYAVKCGIGFDELKKDAFSFKEILNEKSPQNPFTDDDINSALQMYNDDYKSFTRDDIAKITAVPILANKRNGRPQELHLEGARAIQAIQDKYNGTNWREGNGRPSLKKVVYEYLEKHPTAKKAEIARETGLERHTVYKYYDECYSEIFPQFESELQKELQEEERKAIVSYWTELQDKLAELEAEYSEHGDVYTAIQIECLKQSDEFQQAQMMYENLQ